MKHYTLLILSLCISQLTIGQNKPQTLKNQASSTSGNTKNAEVGPSADAKPAATSSTVNASKQATSSSSGDIFGPASANNMIKEGAILFDVGIGMYRSRYYFTGLGWPAILTTSSLEYAFTDKISAGAFAGFYYRRTNLYRLAGSSFRGYHVGVPVGVCASLHLSDMLNEVLDAGVEVDKMDFYGKIYAGLNFERLQYRNAPSIFDPTFVYRGSFNEVYPLIGLTGGMRYKIHENILTNVEIGWGPVSSLHFGLTFKM